MRYVIKVDTTTRLEDHSDDSLQKYEMISIVIQRILGLLEEKIKNSNQNKQLEIDDIIALNHVAVVCNQMVSQCPLFDWTTEIGRPDLLPDLASSTGNNVSPPPEQESDFFREKRETLVSFMTSKLFPMSMVENLIDGIFHIMKISLARLSGTIAER